MLRAGGPASLNTFTVRHSQCGLGDLQVIARLQIHAELRAVTKVKTQADRRIGRNAAPIMHNLSDSVGRDADGLRELILRKPVLCQEFDGGTARSAKRAAAWSASNFRLAQGRKSFELLDGMVMK